MQPPSQPGQPQSNPAASTTEELKSDIAEVGNTAANRLHSEVDARKGTAATQVKSVSSAIERAAGELDDGAPDWLKSAFTQGAQQIQKFADTIENKDSRQLVNDVTSYARNNPTTFLLGCAAVGFAAARVFKAGENGSTGYKPPQQGTQSFGSTSTSSSSSDFSTSGDRPAFQSTDSGFNPSPRGEFV